MRVLFTVSSWHSHYFPMVPLAWALRAAGHDVQVLCAPCDSDVLMKAGLIPAPVLDGLDVPAQARLNNMMTARAGAWPYADPPPHPHTRELVDVPAAEAESLREQWIAMAGDRLRRSTAIAADYMRAWRPELVVHDVMCPEGPLAAEEIGVPSVLHLWGAMGTEDPMETVGGNNKDGLFDGATVRADLARIAGEAVADRVFGRLEYVVDVCPDPVAPSIPAPRIPMRYVPYNGPGAMPMELPGRSDRPRVCVAWGRSASVQFGPVTNKIPEIVQAATNVGADVLLVASRADVEVCGPLPESVHVLVDAPLHLVLPECDAVVHYAGAGVTMTSMAAGVPQLALPLTSNYAALSSRFDRAGCGLSVLNYEADIASIEDALTRLLREPSFALAAATLATQASTMPSPVAVVDLLEEIAEGSDAPLAQVTSV